jgi:hypothetical protein
MVVSPKSSQARPVAADGDLLLALVLALTRLGFEKSHAGQESRCHPECLAMDGKQSPAYHVTSRLTWPLLSG